MKPRGNAPGTPFNFDSIPAWLLPDLWNEEKEVRFRGLLFVLLYTLSVLAFFGLFVLLLSLVFSKPVAVMAWVWLYLGIPGGVIYGLANWSDFIRLRKIASLKKNASEKSDTQIRESPPK